MLSGGKYKGNGIIEWLLNLNNVHEICTEEKHLLLSGVNGELRSL